MNMCRIIAALALLLAATPALSQVTNPWPRFIPVRPDGSVIDPGSVGGGGGGGTVTQGPAATDTSANRWPVLAYQGGTWTFGLSGPIPTGSNVIGAVTQSGGPWSVSGTVAATQSGTWTVTQGSAGSAAWKVDGSGVTQPVSAGSLPLPSGAATAANQNSTAAGTSATNAQGVQGVTGGVALPISVSALPLPTGAATAANQASEISALGTTGDTAYSGSGTASIVSALKGVYNGLLAATPAGTNTIGSLANISGTITLPTGAATSANQSSEIAALNTIAVKAAFYSDLSTSTAVSQSYTGTVRDLGAAPAYSRINAGGNTTQTGTLNILGCYDSACSGTFAMATYTAPAGGGSMAISTAAITRYWRVQFVNGTSAGAANVSSSTTN